MALHHLDIEMELRDKPGTAKTGRILPQKAVTHHQSWTRPAADANAVAPPMILFAQLKNRLIHKITFLATKKNLAL